MKNIPNIHAKCGNNFTYKQLIECGETQHTTQVSNLPKQLDSYIALHELAKNILDPVIENFGTIRLTYGFCSHELSKHISSNVAPKLDQHAAHELNSRNNFICPRLGAAADFIIENKNMYEVAEWVMNNTSFDRLYFYGENLPIHVSYSLNPKGEYVEMKKNHSGRRIPRVVKKTKSL
jgi:hypothetical protein